jgi:hypothetical protein
MTNLYPISRQGILKSHNFFSSKSELELKEATLITENWNMDALGSIAGDSGNRCQDLRTCRSKMIVIH